MSLAGTPWLAYECPACQRIGDVDLRTLDRHPMMPISGLIPSLSCRWCCSNPPFAELEALTAQSTVGRGAAPEALRTSEPRRLPVGGGGGKARRSG